MNGKGIKTRQENELLENNKLIAEFMRVVFHDDENQYYNAGGLHIGNTLQYHTSWDWLMPVIERCLVGEAEQSEEISITTIKNIYEGICNQEISFAYKSVVEFIKWYNEQNRFICGVCGDHVNEYTYNEDKDVDECNKCK
jgi:hypothetical protein